MLALSKCRWDDGGRDCLKVLDAANVTLIGTSADMAICKGTTHGGAPCTAVVNRRLHGAYCDFHLNQERDRIALAARPECKGTLLVTAYERGAKATQRRVQGASGAVGARGGGRSWQEKMSQPSPKRRRLPDTRAPQA